MTHLSYLLARQKQDELAARAERARQLRESARASAGRVPGVDADGELDVTIVLRIADPFHRTAAARQLLRARAAQLHGDAGTARRVRGRGEPALNALPTNPRL